MQCAELSIRYSLTEKTMFGVNTSQFPFTLNGKEYYCIARPTEITQNVIGFSDQLFFLTLITGSQQLHFIFSVKD